MPRRSYSPEITAERLPPRQARFLEEYMVDDNASRAYLAAGYLPRTAKSLTAASSRLLASVSIQSALAARKAALAEHAQVSREQLIDELKAIAFGDPRDVVSWGPDGVRLQESSGLTRDQAITVAEVSETPGRYGTSRRIKRESRLEALDKIAKLLGYYPKEPMIDNRTLNVFSADDAIRALLEARKQLAEPKEG